MAGALLAVLVHERGGRNAGVVSARMVAGLLLDHEAASYWMPSAAAVGLAELADETTCSRVVGAGCLFGAENETAAVALVARLPDVAGFPAGEVLRIARWLRRLYPPQNGGYLGVLAPDLLAEQLAVTTLATCPDLLTVFADSVAAGQAERALRTLLRAGDHDSRAPQALIDAICTDRPRLLPVAVELAAALGPSRGMDVALAGLVSAEDLLPRKAVDHLLAALARTDSGQVLGETAAELWSVRVRHLRASGDQPGLAYATAAARTPISTPSTLRSIRSTTTPRRCGRSRTSP